MKLFLFSLGIALAAGCGGAVNVAGFDDGGSESGSGGSGSSSGSGVCQFCATNQDCKNSCGATQAGNVWCCVSSSCYSLASNLCPASGSSSGGSGSGSGAGGSGGAPSMGAIVCGMAGSCMSPDVCCAGGGMGGGTDICATQSACTAAMGDSYACTGKANCASGQVCCVVQGSNGNPDTAQCQSTCTGNRHYQVCQSSSECPSGRMCRMMAGVALNVCR